MKLLLAFTSFVVVGIASCLMLIVLQCSSTKTIILDTASSAELHKIEYTGGNGDSYESAVIIRRARDQRVGVAAEYQFINRIYGPQDKKWKIVEQALGNEGDKVYDMVKFELHASGETKIMYFDVTSFAKKRKPPVEE
jgi:hypothetical protein